MNQENAERWSQDLAAINDHWNKGFRDAFLGIFEVINALPDDTPIDIVREAIYRECGLTPQFKARLTALPPKPGVEERLKP
jgi:hypothetical protein